MQPWISSSHPHRYHRALEETVAQEKKFYLLSSLSVALPYLPMMATVAFIFAYGGKLIRDGDIHSGTAVLRVFFGVVHSLEGFGQV